MADKYQTIDSYPIPLFIVIKKIFSTQRGRKNYIVQLAYLLYLAHLNQIKLP